MRIHTTDGMWAQEGPVKLPKAFFDVAKIVYANDPMWIPEEQAEIEKAFSAENPWFQNNRAWVACIKGVVRLAVFCHPHDRLFQERKAAFFGYFESTGDAQANRHLFQLAQQWAREQGAVALVGPINFSTFGSYRLRLSAEANACTFPAEPYNPTDYPTMLESLGFTQEQRYLTQIVPVEISRRLREIKQPRYHDMIAQGYCFESLSPEIWYTNLKQVHGMVDQIFAQNFAYTPISFDAFARVCGEAFIGRTCPITSTIAFGPQGDVAGFVLNFPHYGPLVIQAAGSERVPHTKLSYQHHFPLLNQRGFRHILTKTVGVSPVHRSQGVMDAMLYHMTGPGNDLYDVWYGAMIREGNHSARYAGKSEHLERRYALYQRTCEQPF